MVSAEMAPSASVPEMPVTAGGSEFSNPVNFSPSLDTTGPQTSFSELSTQFRPLDLSTDAPNFLDSTSPGLLTASEFGFKDQEEPDLSGTGPDWETFNKAFNGEPDNFLDPDAEPLSFWEQEPIKFEAHPEEDFGVVAQAIAELNDQIAERPEPETFPKPESQPEFTKADEELFADLEVLAEAPEPQTDALEVPLIEEISLEETGLVEILQTPEEVLEPEIVEALVEVTEVESGQLEETREALPAETPLTEEQVQIVAENKALVKELVNILDIDPVQVATKLQQNLKDEKNIEVNLEALLPEAKIQQQALPRLEQAEPKAEPELETPEKPKPPTENLPYNLIVDGRAMRKRFKTAQEDIGGQASLKQGIDLRRVTQRVAEDEEAKSSVILKGGDGSLENILEQGKSLGVSQTPEEAEQKISQVLANNRAVTTSKNGGNGVSIDEFETANQGRDTMRVENQPAKIIEKRPDGVVAVPLSGQTVSTVHDQKISKSSLTILSYLF